MESHVHPAVLNLQGKSDDPCQLTGTGFDEKMLPEFQEIKNQATPLFFSLNKMILNYIFQQYSQAVEYADILENYLDVALSTFYLTIIVFYDSLARLALASTIPKAERKALLKKVARNQKKVKTWAHVGPMNHLHKYHLVEAERCRVSGNAVEAMTLYDQAIAGAREHQFIQEEALANELAARFYLSRKQEKVAKTYLQEAHYLYEKWGAAAKVKQLDEKSPELGISKEAKMGAQMTTLITSAGTSEVLDLGSVLKASQAISGDIVLERLLEKLMKLVIENAGAQRGILILNDEGQLKIEAEGSVDQRTAELKDAHDKILVLEKETTEKQMAGGFAHEMRNALVGPQLVIGKNLGLDKEPHESINLLNNREMKDVYMELKDELEQEKLQKILSSMKLIYANEERMEKGFNLIYKSLSRALSITQLIMDYSKISQEMADTDWVNLDQLIETIVEEHREVFKEQKIKVHLNLQGKGEQVKGHETNFHTVFNNLILNARDALVDPMNQGKAEGSPAESSPEDLIIEITSEKTNSIGRRSSGKRPSERRSFYTVRIKDNGLGILEENASKIYEAFFSTKPESGTGLGLGFVQKIVSLYDGTMEHESEIGKGTAFIVNFPSIPTNQGA